MAKTAREIVTGSTECIGENDTVARTLGFAARSKMGKDELPRAIKHVRQHAV